VEKQSLKQLFRTPANPAVLKMCKKTKNIEYLKLQIFLKPLKLSKIQVALVLFVENLDPKLRFSFVPQVTKQQLNVILG